MAKKFLVISDSAQNRDKAQLAQTLRDKLYAISIALSKLEGVTFIVENFYHVVSTESNQDFQWRATCYVEKNNRQLHWDDVYTSINAIYCPCYESISKHDFSVLESSQQKDMEKLKQQLGEHFQSLVQIPIDDVDHFINRGLREHAIQRTFTGFDGIQAVGKLKTLKTMTRKQIREAAILAIST